MLTETTPVAAPAPQEATSEDLDASSLERAFLARLTVHTRRDGTRVLSRRCREGPVPCEERVAAFARLLAAAAHATGLDPFLLGALAWRESGLNPAAVSRRGAAGILQLHPRGVGRGMRFVVDRDYRAACQSEVEACQGPIVTRGAEALAGAIERCGSLRSALGAYASGHCTERPRHIGRVLEEQETLRALAEE
ncbi:MAG: transglycosylase SLT domain-containing protein [Sandaracinaceae bacterium]